jgi:hypothetical protein
MTLFSLPLVKGVKSNGQWSCDLHVPFFNFFSIFALTLDQLNDIYTLLNPNPTHENIFSSPWMKMPLKFFKLLKMTLVIYPIGPN